MKYVLSFLLGVLLTATVLVYAVPNHSHAGAEPATVKSKALVFGIPNATSVNNMNAEIARQNNDGWTAKSMNFNAGEHVCFVVFEK